MVPLIVALYVAVRLPGLIKRVRIVPCEFVVLLNMTRQFVTLALFEASALAFSDTAPFFRRNLERLSHYEESTNLGPAWTSFTNDICGSNKKTVVFRVNNLPATSAPMLNMSTINRLLSFSLPLGDSCRSDRVRTNKPYRPLTSR